MRKFLIIFILSFTAVVNAQDGIREVSRLYNLWHSAEAVAAEGDYAYVTCGVSGLQMVDISDPGNIDVVGALEMPHSAFDVAVSGDLAYVACRDANATIRIIDISEPANPNQIGVIDPHDQPYPYSSRALNIAIEGDYLFVMTLLDMLIFDVSNTEEPQRINSFEAGIFVSCFEISEHYMYIPNKMYRIEEDGCMMVLDVSDPENPEEAGIFIYDKEIKGIEVNGNYAFAALDSAFLVIDVSDLEDMQVVTLLELEDCRGKNIFLTDNFACVSDRNNVYLIDISDPTQPDVYGIIEGLEYCYDIAATDDMVYATDRNNRLRIFDVADISEPQEIWSFPPLGHILDVELKGSYAFLAAEKAGLKVVDISNPDNPTEVGNCSFPGEASALTIDGDYTYIATGEEGLRILNISNPEDPFEVGCYDSSWVYDVVIVEDFAYITDLWSSFQVLDISDPTEPTQIGTYQLEDSESIKVTASGDYLYVTYGRMGDWYIESGSLNIYDISTPDEPGLVGQLGMEHLPKTVVVKDNIAYIHFLEDIGCAGPESAGIMVVDATEPADPQIMTEYELQYIWDFYPEVNDLVIIGDLLIVANSLEGLHFIDISDPENPFESEHLFTPGIASGVAVFDHYTCVADYSNFGIYDCSEYFSVPYDETDAPEFYTLLTNYPNPFNSSTIINYSLPSQTNISLVVYNQLGRKVTTLFEGHNQAGFHSVNLNANDLPSGLYFIRLEAGDKVDVRKVILMR